MRLSEIVAVLCNEPFCLDVNQAKRLTLFQVRKLYLRERDPKTGAIRLQPNPGVREENLALSALVPKAIRVPRWRLDEMNG